LKAGKAAGCDEIRPEMLKTLNKRVLWLTRVLHSSGLVFWKDTEGLRNLETIPTNWCKDHYTQESRRKKMHQLQGISLLNLYGIFLLQHRFSINLGVCQRYLCFFGQPRPVTRRGAKPPLQNLLPPGKFIAPLENLLFQAGCGPGPTSKKRMTRFHERGCSRYGEPGPIRV